MTDLSTRPSLPLISIQTPKTLKTTSATCLFPKSEATIQIKTASGKRTLRLDSLPSAALLDEAVIIRSMIVGDAEEWCDRERYGNILMDFYQQILALESTDAPFISITWETEACEPIPGFAWTQSVTISGPMKPPLVCAAFDWRFEMLSVAVMCVCKGFKSLYGGAHKWKDAVFERYTTKFLSVWMDEEFITRCDALPTCEELYFIVKEHAKYTKYITNSVGVLVAHRKDWFRKDLSASSVRVLRNLGRAAWHLQAASAIALSTMADKSTRQASALHVSMLMSGKDAEQARKWETLETWANACASLAYEAYDAARLALVQLNFVGEGEMFAPWVHDLALGLLIWAKYTVIFTMAPAVKNGLVSLSQQQYIAMCSCLCVLGCSNGKFGFPESETLAKQRKFMDLELWHPLAVLAVAPWHNAIVDALHCACEMFPCEELVPGAIFSFGRLGLRELSKPEEVIREDFDVAINAIITHAKTLECKAIPCPEVLKGD